MKISNNLSGIAGTYYVAAELSNFGYIALVTMKNTSGIDILVSSEKTFNSIGIQVKTNQSGNRKGWLLSEKNETLCNSNLVYIFVNINSANTKPDFYIVPSVIVSETITKGHQSWLKTPSKSGLPHKDTSLRMFFDNEERYKNKWELIHNLIG